MRRQSQPLHIVFLYCRVCRIICKSNQVVYSHESSLWKQQSPCGGHYGFAGQRHFWSGLFTDLEVIFLYLFSLALSFNLLRIWWVGKTLFYWSQKQSKRAKKKKPTQLWIINRPAHSKWSNELKLISCYFLGGTEYFDNFIHSAALEQMAAKQMLWEGRSSPTTSGTSACTGSTFFQVIPTGYLRRGKKLIFTTVTAWNYCRGRYGWEPAYRCS